MDPVPAPPPDAVHVWFNQEGWKLTPDALREQLANRGASEDLIVELIDEGADRRRALTEREPQATGKQVGQRPRAHQGDSAAATQPAARAELSRSASAPDRGQVLPFPSPEPGALVPPQNLEAEEHVLGAMMLAPGAIDAVSEILGDSGSDFYRESHAKIYRAGLALHAKGEPVDAITMTDALEERGELDGIGGRVRLHELAALVPAAGNAGRYARIVKETATLRAVIRAGGEIARMGWERPGEAAEIVDRAQQITLELGDLGRGETEHISAALKETFTRITDRYESGADMVGLSTGFRDLDRATAGLEDGNLVIIAGRPSMGKSALAHAIIDNVARTGKTVALFSPEMSKTELTQRLLAREAHVDLYRIRTGKLEAADWSRLSTAAATLDKCPIYVHDAGSLLLHTIRAETRRLIKKGLALVVVDYLQLMAGEGENRTQEVSKLSRGLKVLARDLNVPIIALSQLSRAVEQRTNKRPILSDLRESGSIEQDADLVAFLYRDDYYNDDSDKPNQAELIIAKHRNGATDTIPLAFVKSEATYTTLDRHTPGDYGSTGGF